MRCALCWGALRWVDGWLLHGKNEATARAADVAPPPANKIASKNRHPRAALSIPSPVTGPSFVQQNAYAVPTHFARFLTSDGRRNQPVRDLLFPSMLYISVQPVTSQRPSPTCAGYIMSRLVQKSIIAQR